MVKIKNYTNEDLDFIQNNYQNITVKQLAAKLGKTESSIYNAVQKLGLKKQKHKPWTEAENDFLIQNYMSMSAKDMAIQLRRTYASVNTQLARLNLVVHKAWTEQEVDFLKNNFDKKTHKELGEILNRTEQAVRAKCFDLNLYKKEVPWQDWEIEFILNNYREMTKREMSKYLNRTETAIHLKCSKMGIKSSPYTCNYHYFDFIDTEEKAYWLGFLTADGWISKNEEANAGVVGVELQYGDIKHLKKFNKSIQGNYQITDRWRTCSISTNKEKKNHLCVLRIFSLTMYDSLVRLGFTNNKSFDCFIPVIPQNLTRHFIRGYFDGNGCFSFSKRFLGVSFVTASEKLKNELVNCLKQENIEIKEYNHITEYGTTVYRPTINRIKDKIIFLDWIYGDCNIYLDRKYQKYLQVKEYYS